MGTLLIRIVAPMQSWGIQSDFTVRDTGLEPSKSGVIGLICAAMGRPRSAALSDLNTLKLGVRVDREGIVKRDFHIVQDVLKGDGKKIKERIITNRYYLSDAAFLVGLEGENDLLTIIQRALKDPVWPLYLGRKAFVPALPIWLEDGLREKQTLMEALTSMRWVVDRNKRNATELVRIVIEDPDGEQSRNDVPISFEQRKFYGRRIKNLMLSPDQIFEEENR